MKEWLCLTCQVQRALTEAESIEPPTIKPLASPNKVSPPAAQTDVSAKKNDPTQTADTKKDSPMSVSALEEQEKSDSPPTKEVPSSMARPNRELTADVLDKNKQLIDETLPISTTIETSPKKSRDFTPSSSATIKEVSEKMVEKNEEPAKSIDQQQSDEVQPPKAPNEESDTVEESPAKSAASATTNQESGSFFRFTGTKSQLAASKTTDAVTGKMLGFGSSLFSSASTLITSAVHEESRKTPPGSRKMSAPAQVSGKTVVSQISPKSSPPVSPKITSAKTDNLPATVKPFVEKKPDQPQPVKPTPSGPSKMDKCPLKEASETSPTVSQSTCPLCKVDLNINCKDPKISNYNTCTECKSTVCNKCGFSPMPSVGKVIKQSV